MNTTIMAERQAKALNTIAAEVERLGGRLDVPSVRPPNPQVKFTLLLEAVAAGLAGIGAVAGDEDTPPAVKEPAAPRGRRGKEM